MSRLQHPLAPVHDHNSRVLMLGTFPSVKSRGAGFYYMHPQNRFWPLLCALFGETLPPDVNGRRDVALRHGIALWDVLAACEIDGSSDASIRNPVPNDIAGLLYETGIQAIFTTGSRATALYRRLVLPETGVDCRPLPSTSPANRRLSDAMLLEAYHTALMPWLDGVVG